MLLTPLDRIAVVQITAGAVVMLSVFFLASALGVGGITLRVGMGFVFVVHGIWLVHVFKRLKTRAASSPMR